MTHSVQPVRRVAVHSIVFFFSALFAVAPLAALAFGISPPLLQFEEILVGSTVSGIFTLVRNPADRDDRVTVSITGKGADKVHIEPTLVLPQGQTQVPVLIEVDALGLAQTDRIDALVTFVLEGYEINGAQGIAPAVSGRIFATVSDESRESMEILNTVVSQIKFGEKPVISFLIKNTGNVPTSLSLIRVSFTDNNNETHIESGEISGSDLNLVEPYSFAPYNLPVSVKLPAGQYSARVEFFDAMNEFISEKTQHIQVSPKYPQISSASAIKFVWLFIVAVVAGLALFTVGIYKAKNLKS